MQTYYVIINPHARHGETEKLIDVIRELLQGHDATFAVTTRPLHATELAAKACSFDIVIAVGGDGTINEVVNGLMQIEAESRPALAIIPTGSGNDTCRLAGLPHDISGALNVILTGTPKAFDVGKCNERFFISSFSVGIDALVAAKTVELKATRKLSGALLYGSALSYVVAKELKPVELTLSFDNGTPHTEKVICCAITNGTTYGGGFRMNPSAKPDDGKLTGSYITAIGFFKTASYIPLLVAAKHEGINEYHCAQFETLMLTSFTGLPLVAQMDGEIFTGTQFDVRCIPHAIQIITHT